MAANNHQYCDSFSTFLDGDVAELKIAIHRERTPASQGGVRAMHSYQNNGFSLLKYRTISRVVPINDCVP